MFYLKVFWSKYSLFRDCGFNRRRSFDAGIDQVGFMLRSRGKL